MWRNKLIRVHPGAVRTLCTLLWLDLGARHMATALMHLRDYIEAAIRVELQPLAGAQIFEMARLAPQAEFLEAVADGLDALDLEALASEVHGWTAAGGSPDGHRGRGPAGPLGMPQGRDPDQCAAYGRG